MATINAFKRLEPILPNITTVTGTVSSHNTDGTSTITLTGGGVFIANGQTVPIGQLAYIKGEEIGSSVVLSSFNLDV